MDRERAAEHIKAELETYLLARGINTRTNFKCLISEHEHDGSRPGMSYNRATNKAHCFKCNSDFDIFDLISAETGRTGADLFNYAYTAYGLEVDGAGSSLPGISPQPRTLRPATPPIPSATYDLTDVIEEAHQDNRGREHYKSRGLTDEIIDRYKLGYTEDYNHKLLKGCPDLHIMRDKSHLYNYVFPYLNDDGTCNYILAEISDRSQGNKYLKMFSRPIISGVEHSHPAHIFNERYLKGNSPPFVYVCEGIYDALSYEVAGVPAVAFIGTAHQRFLALCREHKPQTHFIITLDNDGAGKQATERVTAGLSEMGMPFTIANPVGESKDANEALQHDREAFKGGAMDVIDNIKAAAITDQERELMAYLNTSAANHITDFENGIKASVATEAISTGFDILDANLDGGLYEGLYIVGAISSLGKTTFCLQLADQIAEQGHDVLIFSLEMARTELMAKSISRQTFLHTWGKGLNAGNAKTPRAITTGKRYENYSQTEKDLIATATRSYAGYADRLFISEGMGDIGAKEIRATVETHARITGRHPVIIVDYLQLLAPYNDRATDKQNTDKAVLELKRISRDHKTPVIAISSFNRMNYKTAVTMEAFKESGAIEYSSDVLIGLQANGAGKKGFDINKAKKQEPREIELVVLKNRNGRTGYKIAYQYFQLFNHFYEIAGQGDTELIDNGETEDAADAFALPPNSNTPVKPKAPPKRSTGPLKGKTELSLIAESNRGEKDTEEQPF